MRKICSYPNCNIAVEVEHFDRSSPRCSEHPLSFTPKKQYLHQHDEAGKVIYSTYKWKKLRKQYAQSQPLCEHCLRYGIYEPLAVVDHIVELSDNGEPYEWGNLQSLCHRCHNIKTNKERNKREGSNGFKSISDF